MIKKLIPLVLILSPFLVILSCSSDDSGSNQNQNEPKELTRIEITSSTSLIEIDETVSLTASGYDQFDNLFEITGTINWSSANGNVSIDENGNATGVILGNSIVTAESEGISGEIEITVWDSSGPRTEIYVSDAGNFNDSGWKILRYQEDGGNPEIFIPQSQNLAWPQDIVFLEETGVVLISNLNTGQINRHDIETGDYIDVFANGIGQPTRMRIGADNLLYVLQWQGNGKVLRYELDGTFVDEYTNVGVNESIGLAWDSIGNLYVSSFSDATVRKFDSSGNDLGLFINSNLNGPTDIWFDISGNLLVNDWQGNQVRKFDGNGNHIEDLYSAVRPEGVGFLPNGDILIGNGNFLANPGSVSRHNNKGNYIEDHIEGGSSSLMNPNAVVVRQVN